MKCTHRGNESDLHGTMCSVTALDLPVIVCYTRDPFY